MEQILNKAKDFALDYGPNLLGALLILFVGYFLAKLVSKALRRIMEKAKVEQTRVSFVRNLAYMLMMTFVVLAALGKLGVETTSFAAVLAAAGLAIGFALQGSLANFAAGVMIIVLKPFKVGDFVEAAGITGVVVGISIFATELKSPDNKKIVVPNATLTGGTITNYSAEETRRIDMTFGVSYNDDLKKAKALLLSILTAHDKVLAEPAPQVAVAELADSSVNFVVRPWVKTDDYWDVMFDITEQVKVQCDAQGISIPFPQQDVHLHKVA